MTKYVDKSILEKEIKRQISAIDDCPKLTNTQIAVLEGDKVVLTKLLSFIDTLETREVDFEEEFDKYANGILACDIQFEPFTHLYNCAKHFFELGLKVQKGEEV